MREKTYTYGDDLYYIQKRVFIEGAQFRHQAVREVVTKSLLKFLFYKLQFWKYRQYVGKNVIRDKNLK